MTNKPVTRRTSSGNLRAVALPTEHGGWGILLEPLLLGLLIAPSGWGVLLALGALSVFLVHHPLRIYLKDRRRGRDVPRTGRALRFALGYALLGIASATLILIFTGPRFIFPLVMAVPLVLVQLAYDVRSEGRALLPEMSGALALGSTAPALALLAGWDWLPAMALWGILAARTLPAVLYVRARLKLERQQATNPVPAWVAHAGGLVLVIGLVVLKLAPRLTILALIILMLRALIGLSQWRTPRSARIVGFQELAYGTMMVLLTGAGFLFKL